MQQIKTKWMQSGLVLVCERCYKERIPEEIPEKAAEIGEFNLRDWLKQRLKEDGHWAKIRAIGTTCMDVCARRHVTVCIDPHNQGFSQAFVVDPIGDREALYERIVRSLAPSGGEIDSTDNLPDGFERYEDDRSGNLA